MGESCEVHFGSKAEVIPAISGGYILPAFCPIEGRVKLERLTWGTAGDPDEAA
jgi:hypothetical protein